jgi:hypothetical protein
MAGAWLLASTLVFVDALGWSTPTSQDGSGFMAGSVVISTISGTPRVTFQILVAVTLLMATIALWAGARQALIVLFLAAVAAAVLSTSTWVPVGLAICALVGIAPLFFTSALDQLWPPSGATEESRP